VGFSKSSNWAPVLFEKLRKYSSRAEEEDILLVTGTREDEEEVGGKTSAKR
jgi:hypothetical protein